MVNRKIAAILGVQPCKAQGTPSHGSSESQQSSWGQRGEWEEAAIENRHNTFEEVYYMAYRQHAIWLSCFKNV